VNGAAGSGRVPLDTRVRIGSVELPNPVLTASGTAGLGGEFEGLIDAATLGAYVVKSLAPTEWPGNPSPRLIGVAGGMLNAVGLQGPGVDRWRAESLPYLVDRGARVVASIWGRSVEEYRSAAAALVGAPVVAVEVNLSCPNLETRTGMFAHDARATADVISAVVAELHVPAWAKLSPNTDRLVEIAGAARDAGAEALTLINTLLGMVLDRSSGRPALANGGGGLSGSAVHPVAVRAVYDVRAAFPDVPIIGVGGVVDGWTAAELMLAGANAIAVGTATFADPRTVHRVLGELVLIAREHGVSALSDITDRAHGRGW
jgi:dihydroorotate dehydrogenase (NAD+) catalytic subunit